jgi:hypothetical protein
MDAETLQARIARATGELRARFPMITALRASLDRWEEQGRARFAMRFDLRWPEHQTILNGPAAADAEQAFAAGMDALTRRLESAARMLRPASATG